ncbi:metalloregulator ArsR/SmtB family transcription factor [Candidatus Saccharibacteria bacterium]|nr:metalloregulator ArsR/SmtB family transcription factor [Candidatus Saccharibacteria bacterium]
MDHEKHILPMFKALADSNRLRIIRMLSCPCGELCAQHMLKKFDITQPTMSHHMKVLIDAGLVDSRKQGSHIYYSINKRAVSQIAQFLDGFTDTGKEFICNCGCGKKKGEAGMANTNCSCAQHKCSCRDC